VAVTVEMIMAAIVRATVAMMELVGIVGKQPKWPGGNRGDGGEDDEEHYYGGGKH